MKQMTILRTLRKYIYINIRVTTETKIKNLLIQKSIKNGRERK